MVAEYAHHITRELFRAEKDSIPHANYMSHQ
jgi:hypothetical protein